uniref:SUZ RNA-binding domain-containing n=1 Tax=Glossina palpalis gambiensis TaxID=67801 RepID=A0A1B0AWW4_9MUSC
MSNGEDVLDNWEEIDEVGLTSALEKLKASCSSETNHTGHETTTSVKNSANNSLDSFNNPTEKDCYKPENLSSATADITAMKLLQPSSTHDATASISYSIKSGSSSSVLANQPSHAALDDITTTFQPVMMVLHKSSDEYQSANYTAPIANQTVKILRRPTQTKEPRLSVVRPKQPLKSLKQREQEYAEARLRILGSAKNPEDDSNECASPASITMTNSSSPPVYQATSTSLSNIATNAASKQNSPRSQSGPNIYSNHFQPQQQQQLQPTPQQMQYQQNFQYTPQNFYYPLQQQQQQPTMPHKQQTPAYNNNRTLNIPLLSQIPQAQYQQQQQQQPLIKYQQQFLHKSPTQQHHQKQQQQQNWSPVIGSASSSSLRQQQQQQQQDSVVRLPRGPDGTSGFQMRR